MLSMALVRFTTRATGICAAAPADTFHAAAVTEAERRSGRITPFAPNAAAERITAPRFCGSVTPSSAMNNGRAAMRAEAEFAASIALAFLSARSTRSCSEEYSNGCTLSTTPWWLLERAMRSISRRSASSRLSPRWPARRTMSRVRSSCSMRVATYSVDEGTPTRSASSTALRPITRSSESEVNLAARRRAARRGSAILRRSAAFLARYAL